METKEARVYQRLTKPFFVAYVNREQQRQTTPVFMGRTHDISIGGAGVELCHPVQPGSSMEMEIELDNTLFAVSGRVIYLAPEGNDTFRAGIRFNEPQYALVDILASTFHAPRA
jgi:hypothetical protein